MKKIFNYISLILSFNILTGLCKAQSLPVGSPVLDDYYRRQQLSGGPDSSLSFAVRPLYAPIYTAQQDIYKPDHEIVNGSVNRVKGPLQILPISWQQQYNSSHPYGWNDGLMIPAKGYQTVVSGGVFLKLGHFSIQLRPQYVYAANNYFESFATGRTDQELIDYYGYHNAIDMPERLGSGSYSKASWGQSSIRFTWGGASVGLSTENLWWGPGIRNALTISNTAPGFKHLTLNTAYPVHTAIGAFEGQVIAGRLDGTQLPPLYTTTTTNGTDLYIPKTNDWRYLTGFNINYQPRWVPGLFVGVARLFNSYHADINGFSGYVPFFSAHSNEGYAQDQVISLYSRWLFAQAKAELYFEYGLNDNTSSFSDFVGSPDHSRAYIFGFRKLMPLNAKNQAILFSTEITQLSQTTDRLIRPAGGWYTHFQVRQGLTHMGQVLGAGTGSGGNLQWADVSWVTGLKKIGLAFERYEHDVDFAEVAFTPINGHSRKWVDVAVALQANWNYKNLLFNGVIQGIKSLNYQWRLKDFTAGSGYVPHNSILNLHTELGITYRF